MCIMKKSATLNGLLGLALLIACSVARAQDIPGHARGLHEELLSVELGGGRKQVGVLSLKTGTEKPTRLAVLLPGSPSVLRPVVENGVMMRSRLNGNFLIRSRRHLADDTIALLLADCHSESGDTCSGAYQASKARQEDLQKLIDQARARLPSIEQVWLVGTSLGTVSSSAMPTHAPAAYAGAIHTATITELYLNNCCRDLIGLDYQKAGIPQFFIHHQSDPCRLTRHEGAKALAEKFKLPLITVSGGAGFEGPPCEAFSEHGFRGKEKEVMTAIGAIIKTGKAGRLEIE